MRTPFPRYFLFVLLINLPASVFSATEWQVDYHKSQIRFSAVQEGKTIDGLFRRFEAIIHFSPDSLVTSRFSVKVDTGSVDTDNQERDDILRSADFFHTLIWPQAIFQTLEITSLSGNTYQAKARLSIRNMERNITFPFTLDIDANVLSGYGELAINRFDYDMAHGDWQDTSVVGPQIRIQVAIEAHRVTTTTLEETDYE